MCLRDPQNRPWYVHTECFIERICGVDLALHNSVKSIITLSLDPEHWQASDPLTGCIMFDSEKGDSLEEFKQELTYKTIPGLEDATKRGFGDLVASNRALGRPAPHPSACLIVFSI